MKLATYNPNVKLNNINGEVRAYGDGGAAQAYANIGQAQGRSLQGIGAAINFAGEQIDSVNVQAASNEYTKRLNDLMYNQENGLMNTKYQGADGITAKFEEEEKKIRQEVGKQFRFYSPKGTMVFDRLTNNSATQRYELVRKHQTQQFEAYKDVTFNNAIEQNTMMAADNYSMPEVVSNSINEAVMSTRVRLNGQGEEVIRAAERKVVGQIAQQVINRAYAQGDLDNAESYIEKYGRYMNPATLTGYAKNVYASRLSTMNEVTAKSIFGRFGDNLKAAYDYINSESFGVGVADNAIKWFKDMTNKGESWGVNTCTKGVNAALTAAGYKPINMWCPTAWEQEKAAGRTFTDRSKLRNGDIVYWDSAGDGDASHVGIYDAKSGMVYQSGTSGFKPISLEAYKLIGFSHPSGRAATPEERNKMYAAYQREVALNKQFEAQAEKEALETTDNEFFQMYKNGVTDPETYRMMAVQKAGDDPKLFRKLTTLGNSYAKVAAGASGSGSSSSGGGKSDPMLEYKLTNMLNDGVSRTAILEFMDDKENNFTGQDKKKALEVLDKYDQGKGQFAYEWDGIKDVVMAEYKQKDKNYAWGNVQQKLIYDINAYRAQHGGQDPDRATVVEWGREALVEGISYSVSGKLFGTNTVKINEATAAAHGILKVVDNPSGGKNITVRSGGTDRTITVTDAQFARIIEQNMSVEQAINAG